MQALRLIAGAAVLACAGLLAACGGGAAFTAPTPGPTCVPGENVQMIYPIPGATGVPDAPQQFVFAVASPLPNNWNAYVTFQNSLANGVYTNAGMETISASQVPQPAATPSIANPVYQSITLAGSFLSGQSVYVWLNNGATNCTPLGPLGSFTTK
ncbi:MAG TPA: hypothetical protein VIK27_03740 [Candidatus Aquilonibacter sp.]